MTLTYAEIAEIIKLIDASSCEEVTLDLDEIKLTMRRQGAGVPAQYSMAPTRSHGAVGTDAAQPAVTAPEGSAPNKSIPAALAPTDAQSADDVLEIRSPMVGTYYQAPSPTSPPFVDIGSVVDVDDPLCLIEVMKLYTTISAKARGRVIEICTENGAMVGANEILFRIEPL